MVPPRYSLHVIQRGIKYYRFVSGAGTSKIKFLDPVGDRSRRNFVSTNHLLLTNFCRNFSCSAKHVNKEQAFPLRFRFSLSFSTSSGFSERPDPFARRPNSKCDPYGQSGKPLLLDKVSALMRTIEPEWNIMIQEDQEFDGNKGYDKLRDKIDLVPLAITREFWHQDYMSGAKFSSHVAAVAQMNAQHFPHKVILKRKLNSRTKSWEVCTQIICRTHVLQGLSHHDFYLATLIDIEAQRPEVRGLLTNGKRSQ